MSKKPGFLTPKAIANRIKAKGLQKLRWYCQMCQKQCRDENGFKCHTMSESHQRQLLLVADNPGMYIGGFSDEFLKDFMLLLSRQYGTRRVNANEVYQSYIKDRNHFHMNATRWETLTGFITWLGRQGMCEVEHTEKGWFIKYIDRSPEALARQAAAVKKDKMEKGDEERTQKMIEQQIARALASQGEQDDEPAVKYTELQRNSEDEKIAFSLRGPDASSSTTGDSSVGAVGTSSQDLTQANPESHEGASELFKSVENGSPRDSEQTTPSSTPSSQLPGSSGDKEVREGFERSKGSAVNLQVLPNALKSSRGASSSERSRSASHKEGKTVGKKRKLTTLEEIRFMEEQQKEKKNRRDNWIAEGIIVKVIHKKLGEKFYKKKGVIAEVRDLFTAVVEMFETGNKIKIDQTHLETVIPAIGRSVLVVNGAYRGHKAILETLDTNNFCATIRIDQGPVRGRLVDKVPYEDISKLYTQHM